MDTITKRSVRAQTEMILASQEFKASKRLSQFLHYVVEQTLQGQQETIKQYTVAVEGLGYEKGFDPLSNPIVRIQAGKLRRALEYYYSTRGLEDPIRIQIPKGKYIPEFIPSSNEIQDKERAPEPSSLRLAKLDSLDVISEGPSIAILPIEYLGNGHDNDYIASGISEEIVIGLTRFQEFFVVGPLNREIVSREQLGPRAIGQKYNVRFLLDGTLRLRNQSLRLTTKLTDTRDGRKLWGLTNDHDLKSSTIDQVEHEIVSQIVTTIADNFGVIPRVMAKEVLSRQHDSLSNYAAILRFHHHVRSLTETSLTEAIEALEEVVTLDPEHDLALALLGDLISTPYWLGYVDSQYDLGRAAELGKRALALNPNSQPAHMAMAIVYYLRFQKKQCLEEIDTALKLNPSNANYLANASLFLVSLGRGEESMTLMDKAMRWNPHHPGWYHFIPFLYHYYRGEYESALSAANGFNTPGYFWDPLNRAAVLAQLDRQVEVEKAVDELLALVPDFETRGRSLMHRMVYQQEHVEMLTDGLHKAGVSVG